jgi:hypothetical protein
MSKSYTVTLVEADDGSGDLILPIPDELWKELGWEVNDTINWKIREDGTAILSKIQQSVVEKQQSEEKPE